MKPLRRLVFLATLGFPLFLRAQAPAEALRDGEARQQTLAADVQKLIAHLDAMLGEFSRNELGGDDAKALQGVRDSLEKLSAAEMQQIVALLQRARGSADAGAARQTVAEAFAAQKGIVVEMQRLIAKHQRSMQALELARGLSALADRQAANLQNGIALGKWVGGKKPAEFDAALKANLEGQQAEQAALAEELRVAQQRLADFAKADSDLTAGARILQALDDAKEALPRVEAAAAALKDGQFFKAVGEEKAARDALRKFARAVAPQQAPSEALRKAERELAKIAEAQKEVGAAATKLAESKAEMAGELAALEDAQADLAAQSDVLAQDLELPARAAADAIRAAQGSMQESRGALAEAKPTASAQNSQAALVKLAEARAAVTKQAALARIAEGKLTGNRAQDTLALQQAAELLAQQQAAAAKNADKSGQAALAQRAQNLANVAGQAASPAAAALAAGAQAAQQAAQQAAAGQAAQAAQQQAAQQFADAAAQLAQAAQVAQQAREKVQQVRRAADEMGEIIKAEQSLERDTARATAKAAKDEDTFLRLAIAQQEVRDRTRSFSRTVVSFAPNVAFESSDLNMLTALRDLEKANGVEARTYEQKAIKSLYTAQKALETLAEEAARIAGELAEEDRAAQAAAQAADAQKKLAQAMAADPAAQDGLMLEAAKAAGDAAANPANSDAAQEALQAAAQALSNALAGTPGAAQQAAQALAAAQAAMAQSMSGLSPAAPGKSGAAGFSPSDPEAVERDSRLAPARKVSFMLGFRPLLSTITAALTGNGSLVI